MILEPGPVGGAAHRGADRRRWRCCRRSCISARGEAAAWYPLYLVAAFYAGLRLGVGALTVAAAAGIVGFVAVIATTPFWQQQAGLAAGLTLALAAMPAGVALVIRALAQLARRSGRGERGAGAVPQRDRPRLAWPGRRDGAGAAADDGLAASSEALPARALLSQINEVLDLAAIESGDFSPAIEPFDLHAVVNDTLALLRGAAAHQGVALTLRLDPHLPYRLRGWPQQLAQILNSLVIAALAASAPGAVRIELSSVARGDGIVQLRLTVRAQGGAGSDPDAFDLAVVRRLVELMGGRLAVSASGEPPARWTAMLPLAIDETAAAGLLDLAQRPVLLVTEDSQFAGELAEPLNAWNADTRWVGGLDDALVYVERFETPHCPVLIVDGRTRVIPALSFVHRAALVREAPPFILFVADAAQVGGLSELGDGELTGLLPAPLGRPDAGKCAARAAGDGDPAPARNRGSGPRCLLAAVPDEGFADAGDRVTPIAAHPRFVAEATAIVDAARDRRAAGAR